MSSIDERIRTLASKAGLDRLIRETSIGTNRWRTVLYNKEIRISTNEVEEITKLFPEYAFWLITGKIMPESGQVSPEYEELAHQQPAKSGTHD